VRDRLLYFLLDLVRLLLRPVALEPAVRAGAGVGRVVGWCMLRSRRRALRNLRLAFPDSTPRWRAEIAGQVFANMGRSLVELLKIDEVRARLDSYIV